MSGTEVNAVLRRTLGLSGTALRRVKWLEDGIRVDGVRVTVRYRLHPGQLLSVRLTDPDTAAQPVPHDGPLNIVYEDEDLVVVNKSPDVLVHPGHGHFNDTVGNFLMAHYRQAGSAAGFHPVHRLDKGTSGLFVAAKHPFGQEKLKKQLHTGDFRRVYLAVCDGAPPSPHGVIRAPIGPMEGSRVKREVRSDGKPACTCYRVLKTAGPRTLVELELDTGRTHQIRVHMAHIGCPLTGDFLYGRENLELIRRPALHSARLALTHPLTGARLEMSCPIPEDMMQLLGNMAAFEVLPDSRMNTL